MFISLKRTIKTTNKVLMLKVKAMLNSSFMINAQA